MEEIERFMHSTKEEEGTEIPSKKCSQKSAQ